MASEKLKFKIELYSTHWDKAPGAEIFVNNKSFYKDKITGTEKNPSNLELIHIKQVLNIPKNY